MKVKELKEKLYPIPYGMLVYIDYTHHYVSPRLSPIFIEDGKYYSKAFYKVTEKPPVKTGVLLLASYERDIEDVTLLTAGQLLEKLGGFDEDLDVIISDIHPYSIYVKEEYINVWYNRKTNDIKRSLAITPNEYTTGETKGYEMIKVVEISVC